MKRKINPNVFWWKAIGCAICLIVLENPIVSAEGLTHQAVHTNAPQIIEVGIGSSIIIDSPVPFTRTSVANPEVADTIVLSPKQIYLTGKAVGVTTLTLWGKDKRVSSIFDVHIAPDVNRLKNQLHQIFPNETKVRVSPAHDGITLSGTVSSTGTLAKIVAMAEPYAPKKIVNLMQVGGVQQVMLEVHVAEMQRALIRRLGVNFTRQAGNGDFFLGHLNDLSTVEEDGNAIPRLIRSAVVNSVLGFGVGSEFWTIFLDLLKQHNLSKVLAEPTLVAISGQEAQFLAGGEFPIPIPQAFGVTTIRFKQFGVRLLFNPTVLNDKKISLKIEPEVSELDFANGISSQGFTIPAFATRRVATVLELDDGQSFAIAGLLQENIRETVAKYPILGDIPVLGTLFRSTQFQKNETELVVIVTPRLVKPLDLANQTLPTDSYLEPNDFELMLLGYMEGVPSRRKESLPSTSLQQSSTPGPVVWESGNLDGTFGHLAPQWTQRRR